MTPATITAGPRGLADDVDHDGAAHADVMPAATEPAGMPVAARDGYAAAALPARGARVCIAGFPAARHEEVASLLESRGYLPTAFTSGADAVLVPGLTPSIVEDAARAGRLVLVPEQLAGDAAPVPRRSAVEVDADAVRVLDVTLPRRPADAARPGTGGRFAHLCLDGTFMRAARAVAIAADVGLPCALEGDTAVAKTTAVLWVAHLCRQDAVRLNLSGQSDTGELVGRFVPDATRDAAAWRFQEGVVPDAMRHGRWVILDELNLAEAQVLERLNPALENPATLVLSENGGERFGPGGDVPVADTFRVFATMNPAEFSGRSVLSPAFRDRFGLWNVLESPGEAEYRALLARLVHGVQPEFLADGTVWKASDGEPLLPGLAADRRADGRIDGLLDAVASFHFAVAAAAAGEGGVELGRIRRERYVFTRRTLLSMMTLLDRLVARGDDVEVALARAIDTVYLQRVQPGPDRQAIRTALRTVGIVA